MHICVLNATFSFWGSVLKNNYWRDWIARRNWGKKIHSSKEIHLLFVHYVVHSSIISCSVVSSSSLLFFYVCVCLCVWWCVLCSSSGYAKLEVDGSDQTTPVMPINPASDPAPSTKKQVKRRIRRRRESTGTVGCAKECVDQTKHSRSHKQVHTHSDSSSEDEQRWREARSWSREKARRRRSGSRHTQALPREERDGIELMSVNSDEGQKENQPPLCKGPNTKAHKKLLKKERGGQSQAANHRKGRDHGTSRSGSEEEEPITKTYEERGSGDPDMSVPSTNKCTNPTNQNGAMQHACTDDELEVCRWERAKESCTPSETNYLINIIQYKTIHDHMLQQGFSNWDPQWAAREWQGFCGKV